MSELIITNGIVITPFEELRGCCVQIKDGKILNIDKNLDSSNAVVIDAKENYVLPGLIDIHNHGAMLTDAGSANMGPWFDFNVQNGIATILPTLLTKPLDDMLKDIENLVSFIKSTENSINIAGINIEGPYLNPCYGIQQPENCIVPDQKHYLDIIKKGCGLVRIMTVAPELAGSMELIEYLIKNRIKVSIGHTDAPAETTHQAIIKGADCMTHAFNAFGYPGPKYKDTRPNKVNGIREIKAIDVLLENDDVYAELISDRNGRHVSPLLQRLLFKIKGVDKAILITDAVKYAGLDDGQYQLNGSQWAVIDRSNDDVMWLKDKKVLGGSIYSLQKGIRNLMKNTGLSISDAVKTATINPARYLGLDNDIGSIETGKNADITILDHEFNVTHTIINGNIVFESGVKK